jgi:hypothetical protein
VALALLAAAPASAAQRTEAVRFKAGTSAATLSGRIKGDDSIDYTLRAGAGQSMTVRLAPDNASCTFNLYPPGGGSAAMHMGAVAGNSFTGTLPAAGSYRAQVYLDRNAARRNETCKFSITFEITAATPGAAKPAAPTPGKDEQACLEAVAREANNTTVTVLGTAAAAAGHTVTVGVGLDRTPWTCAVKDGEVAEISAGGL